MAIEKHNFNMPARMSEQSLPDRYQQPAYFAPGGQLDRQHEGQHVVRMRDMQRDAIESATEQAKQEFELNAWIDCRGRALTEAKYRVLRNHKESQFLAADDPILQAQFGVLDDEFYRDLRIEFNDWK